jgi:pyruvate,orthophosphate dikinase
MLEVPRACIVAAELMAHADFFSFGTNDLTQTTLGLSRDDAERTFLAKYLGDGLIGVNPFGTIDTEGVGWLVRHAVNSTRAKDSSFSIGACGEHAGEPASIQFFHDVGVGYVSCSPYRIQEARLAAAQAALRSDSTPASHQETPTVPSTRVNGARNGAKYVSGARSTVNGSGEVRIRTGS